MSLTLAVPSYQRREHLAGLLDSIERSVLGTHVEDLDVVVVLDGSTDGSRELIEARRKSFPVALRAVWKQNGGPASTRNRCATEATGELIWFVDDDMRINSAALEAHLGWNRDTTPIVMGPCSIRSDDPAASVARDWYDERWARLGSIGLATDPEDIAFANASMPRELALRYRFDEAFRGYGAEDVELAVRLVADGVAVGFCSAADIEHVYTPAANERLTKRREEGRNRVVLNRLHPGYADPGGAGPVGRFERAARRLARGRGGALLWPLALVLSRLGDLPLPGAASVRLQTLAETAAAQAGAHDAASFAPPARSAT